MLSTLVVSRRRHSAKFKARILAECSKPGASIALIARENGLNANMVHNWQRKQAAGVVSEDRPSPRPEFVPLPIAPGTMASGEIRVAVRRGALTLEVAWPVSGASACAQWLRELLR